MKNIRILFLVLILLFITGCNEITETPQEIEPGVDENIDSEEVSDAISENMIVLDFYSEGKILEKMDFVARLEAKAQTQDEKDSYEWISGKNSPSEGSMYNGSSSTFTEMGKVQSSKYNEYSYIVWRYNENSPSQSMYYKFLANDDRSDLILLENVSDEDILPFPAKMFNSVDSKIEVKGVTVSEEFSYKGFDYKKKSNRYSLFDLESTFFQEGSVISVDSMEYYLDKIGGCLYVRLLDGTTQKYTADYKFISETKSEFGAILSKLDITLNDGTSITDETYSVISMGCGGFFGCFNIVPQTKDFADDKEAINANAIDIEKDLEIVGQTSTGENIYALKDINNPILQDRLAFLNEDVIVPSDQKYLMLFYKNEFDLLVNFINTKMVPPVECGKPVVYLYPEIESTISVKVEPDGGITKSEPDYLEGWNVIATSDGILTNLADNKTYTSLFWESSSYGEYMASNEGFLISEKNKFSDLNNILLKYGLNKTERAEFLEYWTEKLQGHDYYFATVLPQSQLDKVAPLTITPKPDTIYRLFFNFYPASKTFEYKEQVVSKFVRKGFTVVEWGGSFN